MTHDELLKFAQALSAENAVFRRENSLLRKELRRYLMLDIQRTWTQASDEEAEEQAEKEIAWKILHNEGEV